MLLNNELLIGQKSAEAEGHVTGREGKNRVTLLHHLALLPQVDLLLFQVILNVRLKSLNITHSFSKKSLLINFV